MARCKLMIKQKETVLMFLECQCCFCLFIVWMTEQHRVHSGGVVGRQPWKRCSCDGRAWTWLIWL